MTPLSMDAYQRQADVLVVLNGRLVTTTGREAKERISRLLNPRVERLSIDLDRLEYLDSAGLGVLIGLKMRANRSRTTLTLLAPPPPIEEIFRVSKLNTIFNILDPQAAAAIRDQLLQEHHCLWRDKDGAPSTPSSAETVFPMQPMTPPDRPLTETEAQARQLALDAAEYIRQGDYQRAISAYQNALEFDPENIAMLNNLAVIFEKRPEWYSKARMVWQNVLDLGKRRGDDKHAARAERHLCLLQKLTSPTPDVDP